MKIKNNESGIAHIAIVLLVVFVLAIGFVGWRVAASRSSSSSNGSESHGSNSTDKVSWQYVNDAWKSSGTPPACPNPLLSVSPVDITNATAILYPGQTRGVYKPHGGYIFKNAKDNNVPVVLSMDAKIIDGTRYIESNTIQYMFDFINECGIRLRYDHLLTLSPAFQKIAQSFPEPKVNDSRTTDIQNGQEFKAGDTIATAIGFPSPSLNVSMDFGVYDMRKPNTASRIPAYASAHKTFAYADYYAVCWLSDLPSADAKIALSLPGGDGKMGKTSDYCK